jgi:hypothetical protein
MNDIFPTMKPLVRVYREASTAMIQRAGLLAQPCEFFAQFFGGRTPTVEEKVFWIEGAILRMTSLHLFANDLYEVEVRNEHPFICLSITRHDGQSCKEWKHLQQIKNELIGPENEAVELFPAESRLIDTNNEYHIWVHADPHYRFPVGWNAARIVLDEPLRVPNPLHMDSAANGSLVTAKNRAA